jgi:hypothetical protein
MHMQAVFHWHRNPAVNRLMDQARCLCNIVVTFYRQRIFAQWSACDAAMCGVPLVSAGVAAAANTTARLSVLQDEHAAAAAAGSWSAAAWQPVGQVQGSA